MNWIFARNEGGRDAGFHDAGVETFKGNFDRYLARELIQNSLDARLDSKKPVHVKFELLTLDRKDIPDIKSLKATFARCAEYWDHQKKAREFFERAVQIAGGRKIMALRIGDYNTTGVLGTDTERSKDWYNLIRCAGSSSKSGDEGGSFGIGKNAPFAASQMRTVLYSTLNDDGEHVFQGVATLASHALPSGATAQPTGYLGLKNGASVRSKSEIPSTFIRKQRGTDIIVLGFPSGPAWQKDLLYAVLEHFWPAIEWGDLTVSVGEEKISPADLPKLMEQFSGEEDFTAHLYYQAYKNPSNQFNEKLPELKSVSLYLSAGDADMPKRVAMVRKTGMVIFAKPFRSVIPFCGVFVCKNETGNKLLREMEPPRHDTWDADHPEKGANKPTESEYVHFIRECVKELAPLDDSKVLTLPGLNRFLPDDDDTPEEAFDTAPQSKGESHDRSPLPEKIPGKTMESRRAGFAGGTEGGGGNGGGGGGGNRGGGGGGDHGKPSIPIQYRTYAMNGEGVYMVTVRPEQKTSQKVKIALWLVGDDQRSVAEVKSARLPNGKNLRISSGGLLGPLQLPSGSPLQIEVRLQEPLRVAMEVSAHEA